MLAQMWAGVGPLSAGAVVGRGEPIFVPLQMKNGENVTDGWWTIDPYERQPPPPYARP